MYNIPHLVVLTGTRQGGTEGVPTRPVVGAARIANPVAHTGTDNIVGAPCRTRASFLNNTAVLG
eukprot:5799538-Lingulodinium_polyedra.AAC.1